MSCSSCHCHLFSRWLPLQPHHCIPMGHGHATFRIFCLSPFHTNATCGPCIPVISCRLALVLGPMSLDVYCRRPWTFLASCCPSRISLPPSSSSRVRNSLSCLNSSSSMNFASKATIFSSAVEAFYVPFSTMASYLIFAACISSSGVIVSPSLWSSCFLDSQALKTSSSLTAEYPLNKLSKRSEVDWFLVVRDRTNKSHTG